MTNAPGKLIPWTLYAVACAAVLAQSPQPAFEAASVKPMLPDVRTRSRMAGGPDTSDPGQITYTNVTLASVLLGAYDIKNYQLTGPDWLSSRRYEIIAKIPPGTAKERFRVMLQNLLAERFHLALHHEMKDLGGFDLVVGKNGPKLKPSVESDPAAAPQPAPPPEPATPPKTDANGFPHLDGPGMVMMEGVSGKAVVTYLTAKAQPVSALVEMLSREFRLPIADKTGLSAKFDFTLEFAPQPPGALPPRSSSADLPDSTDDSAPNLITAVQQQLGLKLNPGKVRIDVLIVDRADQVPAGN
jgi:uncharacterized protein (TIGR03435 family)